LKALLTDIGKALSHGDRDAAIALINESDI